MPSEVAEAAEEVVEQAEAAKEEAVEAVSEAVEQVQEAVAETLAEAPAPVEEPKLSWAARLKQGLTKSRDKMAKSLAGVFGGGQIDEDLYEELETVLITSDMGMEATEYLMKDVRDRVSLKGLKDGNELRGALKDALYDLIKPLEKPLVLPETKEPFVIMLAGINGAAKPRLSANSPNISKHRANLCCWRQAILSVPPRVSSSSLGRTQQCDRDFANYGRFRSRLLRCRPSGQSARYRHRAGRYSRPSADAASFDGRN